jgi:hypothetical protein
MRRYPPLLAGVLWAGCQCTGMGLSTQRFVCTTTDECAPGYACVAGLCASSPAGDTDAGTPDAGAPADGGFPADGGSDAGCGFVARVQSVGAVVPNAGSNTLALNLPSAEAEGDYVVVGINYDPTACVSVSQVSDTSGNPYQQVIPPSLAMGTALLEIWGAADVAAAQPGANTVSVTFSASCFDAGQDVKIIEYAGIARTGSVDTTASSTGSSTSPSTLLNTNRPAVLVAISADQDEATDAGPGWNLVLLDQWGTLAEDQLAPVPGAYSVTYMNSGLENWVLEAVALTTCGGAAGP